MSKNSNKQSPRSDTTQPSKRQQKSEEYRKYQSYIRGRYWKEEIRPKVLERDGYRCMCCGRTSEDTDLTVHHASYSILYKELEGDNLSRLITLCKICHKAIHSARSNYQRFKMKDGANTPKDE